MEGIRLQQPEGWDDKSMIAFNAPEMPESGVLPNIVVTQDGFGDVRSGNQAERIKAFAEKQIADMKAKLPDPVIHSQILTQVAGRAAAEVHVSWRHGNTKLSQLVTFIARNDKTVTICTGTAAESDFNEHRDEFRRMVQAMQIAA
jgi:hypothetical protein